MASFTHPPKFRDRNPDIHAAGKVIPKESSTKECFSPLSDRPETPERVKQFRCMTRPEAGKQRVLYSFASDPPTAKEIAHGINTRTSLEASALVNPQPKSLFEHVSQENSEQVYKSKTTAPLGHSNTQLKGLPPGINPETTRFGISTIKDDSAGDMVSPQKTRQQVEAEDAVGKDLYKKSHNDYDVGELVDRNYDWSKFTKSSLYGVPTPHDNSGGGVKNSMHWLHLAKDEKAAQLVSKRVDNFRRRTQPQLEKVHDPLADTLNVPGDHTFGTMVQPDEYGAGDLIHLRGKSTYEQCGGFDAGLLSSIRNHLKKSKFYNIEGLLGAFLHIDKERSGLMAESTLRDICFQYNIPLDTDMLGLLVKWSTVSEGTLQWIRFIDLINWKGNLLPTSPVVVPADADSNGLSAPRPQDSVLEGEGQEKDPPATSPLKPVATDNMTPNKLEKMLDSTDYCTSSQTIQSVVDSSAPHSTNLHTYGVPTIRSDRPPPRIRRVGDSTNYGDESDAYGLMYPSVYSNKGVHEADFFEHRSEATLKELFKNIGVDMTDEVFLMLWQEAASRHPDGKVSVESFRAVLEEVQSQQQKQDS